MADGSDEPPKPVESPASTTEVVVAAESGSLPRSELLDLAVNFLESTGKELGLGEEASNKRREFLKGKGLSDEDIERAEQIVAERERQVASPEAAPEAVVNASQDAQAPAIPSRNYDTDPRLLRPPPPPTAPNRTIVRFLRFLAYWIFVTGVSAGALAVFCRRVLHPRIVQRTSIIHGLTDSTSEKYTSFLASLRNYARSASHVYPRAAAIASRAPEPPTETGAPVEEAAQTQADPTADVSGPALEPRTAGDDEDKSDASSSTAVSETPATTKVIDDEDFAPADLSAPLRESLAELSRTLRRYSRRRTLPAASAVPITPTAGGGEDDDDDEADVGPPRPPPQALLRSVESFVSMLNTTTYTFPQATRAFVNPYLGGAGAVGTVAGSGDAVAACKSEVRSLKGMLLNRRNFVGRSNTPTPVAA